jgi:hypothetical protein
MMHIQRVVDLAAPTMTVEDAADYLGISRTTAYAEAQRYRRTGGAVGLPNLKFGGRVLVITALVIELLHARTDAVVENADSSPLQLA